MNIQITKQLKSATGTYVTAQCEKVNATVAVHAEYVQVICANASHKVWRGSGRIFPNVDAAVAGYKKSEMKAIILAAAELHNEAHPVVTH